MKVTITFDDEWDFREFWERSERNAKAAQVVGALREQLRNITKYGEPTGRDEYWYARLWELCETHDLDGWSL